MRQIIDLRGSLPRLRLLRVDISAQTASAVRGRAERVMTESEDHAQCLRGELQLLPAPPPTGSNKTWTKDALC